MIVAILVAENGRVEDSELKRALALTESLDSGVSTCGAGEEQMAEDLFVFLVPVTGGQGQPLFGFWHTRLGSLAWHSF